MALAREGKLEFLGGKPELIRLGEFDDVDLTMMTHLSTRPKSDGWPWSIPSTAASSNRSSSWEKRPTRARRRAGDQRPERRHGGTQRPARPEGNLPRRGHRPHPPHRHQGRRPRQRRPLGRADGDIRPGQTAAAIEDADAKLNRALRAGAVAVGGQVKVTTLPGYMPLVNDRALAALFKANALSLIAQEDYVEGGHRTGSTDMGDVTHIMPAIHPFAGGARGTSHGSDYEVPDMDTACFVPAKAMAMTVADLLAGEARAGTSDPGNQQAPHDEGGVPRLPAQDEQPGGVRVSGGLTRWPSVAEPGALVRRREDPVGMSPLSGPITLGSVTLRNRLLMAPLTTNYGR